MLDPTVAAIELENYAADRALAREATYAEWLARPWHRKLVDKLCALTRSQI